MNSLGYTEEERFHRADIAIIQLVKAIELFVIEQFIPSITLAGAAEEILGKLLQERGEVPVLEESFTEIQKIRDATDLNAWKESRREKSSRAGTRPAII